VRSRNARRGGGLGRNQKPSCCGSVSGAPCETAMGDGASGWHGSTYEAVVVVGSCGREARGGEGIWVKIPKPSRRGSVSGCNGAAEGGEGCCGVTAPPPVLTQSVGMVVSGVVMEVVVVVLTWHPSTSPLLPTHSHPLSTHSWSSLQLSDRLGNLVCGQFCCVLVVDERLDALTRRVWRSFKLRPFSIKNSIFIVAYSTGCLKSWK
jgi:hypothetical protein